MEKKINKNEEYMKLAIELAKKGTGRVNPNPLVGAVVVKDNKIVGTGYHQYYGGSHAEVYALEEAGEQAKGATIYVTLEPCSHYGKTPPCAKKIIEMGIKRCFVGSSDPNPKVAGNGINMLRSAGIEVIENVLKNECDELNQIFFKYIRTKEPYLFLKCGITLDGKIALSNGISKWITNELAREKVQYYRHKFMGIMVGINTIIEDNPSLTARTDIDLGDNLNKPNKLDNGEKTKIIKAINPYRIIVDPNLKIDESYKVVNNNNDKKTIIITSIEQKETKKQIFLEQEHNVMFGYIDNKQNENKQNKIDFYTTADKNINEYNNIKENQIRFSMKDILLKIGEFNIDSVLLEGGESLISLAFKEDIIDSGEIFISNKILGDTTSKPFISGFTRKSMYEAIVLKNVKNNIYGDNIGMEFYLKKYK